VSRFGSRASESSDPFPDANAVNPDPQHWYYPSHILLNTVYFRTLEKGLGTKVATLLSGAHYGLCTLLQLLWLYRGRPLPQVLIRDRPRFPVRGILLGKQSCFRYCMTVPYIEFYLDEDSGSDFILSTFSKRNRIFLPFICMSVYVFMTIEVNFDTFLLSFGFLSQKEQ
jgi:hypothetical protein